MSGIYMHIPFCRKACHYCNFHFSTNLNLKDQLIDAMIRELDQRHSYLLEDTLETIYFGGGTPSVLNEKDFDKLLNAVNKYYDLSDQIEISLEANPDDLNTNYLKLLKQNGINRLSIGIQSFFDDDLLWMNRSHNVQQAEQCLLEAQNIGLNNISIDLIFGGPTSNMDKWKSNLDKIEFFDINHLSCYGLTVEPETALQKMIAKGKTEAPREQDYSKQFLRTIEIMESKGFTHYEISNYGRGNTVSKHNSNYWKGVPYLGIGPSSHSFCGDSRQWNISHNKKYIDSVNSGLSYFEIEQLSRHDQFNEYLMTGLRTIWGCDINRLKLLDEQSLNSFLESVNEQIDQQNIYIHANKYLLTNKGKLIANSVISDLFVV